LICSKSNRSSVPVKGVSEKIFIKGAIVFFFSHAELLPGLADWKRDSGFLPVKTHFQHQDFFSGLTNESGNCTTISASYNNDRSIYSFFTASLFRSAARKDQIAENKSRRWPKHWS
jgi:hypothetical protein